MFKCDNCGNSPVGMQKMVWMCSSCRNKMTTTKASLDRLARLKKLYPEKEMLHCKACGSLLDDGDERIYWKCSCGKLLKGSLDIQNYAFDKVGSPVGSDLLKESADKNKNKIMGAIVLAALMVILSGFFIVRAMKANSIAGDAKGLYDKDIGYDTGTSNEISTDDGAFANNEQTEGDGINKGGGSKDYTKDDSVELLLKREYSGDGLRMTFGITRDTKTGVNSISCIGQGDSKEAISVAITYLINEFKAEPGDFLLMFTLKDTKIFAAANRLSGETNAFGLEEDNSVTDTLPKWISTVGISDADMEKYEMITKEFLEDFTG